MEVCFPYAIELKNAVLFPSPLRGGVGGGGIAGTELAATPLPNPPPPRAAIAALGGREQFMLAARSYNNGAEF